jgi:hypothetical protein
MIEKMQIRFDHIPLIYKYKTYKPLHAKSLLPIILHHNTSLTFLPHLWNFLLHRQNPTPPQTLAQKLLIQLLQLFSL